MSVSAVLLIAVALCGCSAVARVSARLHGGTIEFAYCQKYSATKVDVDVTPNGKQRSDYAETWAASGLKPMDASTPVIYGTPPRGFTSTIGPKRFDVATSQIEVAFKDVPHEGSIPALVGDFSGGDLTEHDWRNWKGQLVKNACDG